ncbi:hypothetical protein AB0B45_25515 [Nonomuraea sp. NPDC049152]
MSHRPDVAVVDLEMPALGGLEVSAELAATWIPGWPPTP